MLTRNKYNVHLCIEKLYLVQEQGHIPVRKESCSHYTCHREMESCRRACQDSSLFTGKSSCCDNPIATLAAQCSESQLIFHQPQRETESCTDLLNSLVAKLSQMIRNYKIFEPKTVLFHTCALQERSALRNPFPTAVAQHLEAMYQVCVASPEQASLISLFTLALCKHSRIPFNAHNGLESR